MAEVFVGKQGDVSLFDDIEKQLSKLQDEYRNKAKNIEEQMLNKKMQDVLKRKNREKNIDDVIRIGLRIKMLKDEDWWNKIIYKGLVVEFLSDDSKLD